MEEEWREKQPECLFQQIHDKNELIYGPMPYDGAV